MKNSMLPVPFAKAMDVLSQVLFLITSASFTIGKFESAYDLNQVSKCNIAPENLELTKHFREDILSKAYPRTMSYPDELQLLPTQQDVQQN